MKKLMLLDGMALVYRAFYALNRSPRVNSKGMNTSAVLGFTTTCYDLMRSQHPTHIGVAFDLQTPTFRHEAYAPYKANREAMPEDIGVALPYIHRLLAAFHIPILTCEGFEADDVIGAASVWAEQHGFDEILMVTPDKDFAQLVTDRVHLYRFGRGGKPDTIYGPREVCEAFGVDSPKQVIDLLGLWGDSIDNIPGVPGIGEKKAKQLLAQFGTIEEIIRRSDEIKNNRLREQVQQYADQALLSKRLATICLSIPCPFSEEALLVTTPDYAELRRLFDELEFRTFAKRFFTDLSVSHPDIAIQYLSHAAQPAADGAASTATDKQTADSTSQSVQTSLFDLAEPTVVKHTDMVTLSAMPAEGPVAIYVEDGTMAIATTADEAYTATLATLDTAQLKRLMESDALKVCFDLKSLKYALRPLGISVNGAVFDIQLVHYLVNAELRHTIAFIATGMLNYEPADVASKAGSLWQLYPLLSSALHDAALEPIYYNIELPLVDVLMSMETEGVRIDVDALKHYSASLTQERNAIEQQIYTLAGCSFNINSPKQLADVLYNRLKIVDKPPKTGTKQYSTAEEVLQKMRDKHPIVAQILAYRSLSKLIGTYLDSFPKLIDPATQRLHTVYNQTVTATGRLSSSNPNLQNIPIRTERGREIRKAFVPRNEDYVIMAADYSQIELRIIASLSGDEHLQEAFLQHHDIHAATAARIYGVPLDQVTPDQRRNAKSVNFGIVYGISAFGLSQQLNIARKEAAELIEEYFVHYPKVKLFIDDSIAAARQRGYAQTLLGRRRYLADINSRNASLRSFAERNAVNMPIQGTSADMIKIAMNGIYRDLTQRQLLSRMILQVHDELVFDVYQPEVDTVRQLVEQHMTQALPLSIPVEVSIGVGANWLEAH